MEYAKTIKNKHIVTCKSHVKNPTIFIINNKKEFSAFLYFFCCKNIPQAAIAGNNDRDNDTAIKKNNSPINPLFICIPSYIVNMYIIPQTHDIKNPYKCINFIDLYF